MKTYRIYPNGNIILKGEIVATIPDFDKDTSYLNMRGKIARVVDIAAKDIDDTKIVESVDQAGRHDHWIVSVDDRARHFKGVEEILMIN